MIIHRVLRLGTSIGLAACGLVAVCPAAADDLGLNVATVDTHVHDSSHNDLTGTTVTPGTVVHDEAVVTKGPGTPVGVPDPTGRVTFALFDNATCNGLVVATDADVALSGSGTADSATFTTPPAGGAFSYRAQYSGDANYPLTDGPCEPFLTAASVPSVVTHVRDAANNDLTGANVPAGTVVHDEAVVARGPGTPVGVPDPTGRITFALFDNATCNGLVVATDANVALSSSGTATSASFTTPAAGGAFSYRAQYGGDVNYLPQAGECETFTAQAGLITPTNVDCADVLAGTAPALGHIAYRVSGSKIALGLSPGVFFYWTKITTAVPNQVVTVTQSNTSTNNAARFTVLQGWARAYTGDCASYRSGTLIVGLTGASFIVPQPGSYLIGLKYTTKSISGTVAPVPTDITYDFTTSLGGGTGASVLLKKDP